MMISNKKNITRNVFVLAGMLLLQMHTVQAQQDSQYTQYQYNAQQFNPAYSGSRGVLSLFGIYRNQWLGLEGAPKTMSFSMHKPVGNAKKIGFGLAFMKDQIGPADEGNIVGDFSYSIYMGSDKSIKLAFGLKGGFNLLNVDYNKLNIHEPNDALQQYNISNRLSPIIGAGVYVYNNMWYAGVSIPNILETTHYDETTTSNAGERANMYVMAGYVYDMTPDIKFKPAVLGKIVLGSPLALDITANFLFNEKLTIGAAYRLDSAISGLVGFQINKGLLIGYAYDYNIQGLSNYNSGSHEIFLRFELAERNEKLINPRFF